jgi:hypothetical protein
VSEDYANRLDAHKRAKAEDSPYNGRKPTKPRAIADIHYKGGRKQVSAFHSTLKLVMQSVIAKHQWAILGIRGYEADDIAATLVALNNDTDWLGLVGDNVHWFCLSGHSPRVRADLKDVNTWATSRLDTTFTSPRELWDYKALNGDASDKLPCFTPLEVIDLLQPPEIHKLWLNEVVKSQYGAILDENHDDSTFALAAEQYLMSLRALGIKPCVTHTA